MEDELVGKIKHVYTDTNFTVVGSQSGKISKNALKRVKMFKKIKNPDIVEIPQTGETLKTTLISDPKNPSPMDNYIIIRPKTKAGKTPKLLLMKADFHQVRPIRDLVEDKGEYEGEELRGKAYSEKKIAIGEAFGSSKQQRALKKNSTKKMFKKTQKYFALVFNFSYDLN